MTVWGHVDDITLERVIGWAADPDRPNDAIELTIAVDGTPYCTLLADLAREGLTTLFPGATGRYGFEHYIVPPLSSRRSHTIEVVIADTGALLPNGSRTIAAPGERHEGLAPLIITSTGRAGTTLLMQEFAQQPEIVTAGVYPYEIKLAAYFAATLSVLTHPRSSTDEDANIFGELAFKQQRAVANPWNQPLLHRAIAGEHLARLFRDSIPQRLKSAFNQIIQDYYGTIGVHDKKQDPIYFAEKSILSENIRQAMQDLFGPAKEIALVRDPRDYLCSARAFWAKSIDEGIESLRSEIGVIDAIHKEASANVLFVRYEDLILDPHRSRRRIYDFLGIAGSEVPVDVETLEKHATAATPVASIGRWRSELTTSQASACKVHFAAFMEAFHYQ
jgi:hypothetical protein